ncbi:hypothetical protein ACFQYP_10120 [Nonomuraea antimicrobica]
MTHFRPAYEVYPKVSAQVQEAMEAVTTGRQSPEEATAAYVKALPSAVGGPDKVVAR